MAGVGTPIARAASIYSFSLTASTDERESRAYCGTYTIPTAIIRFVMLGPRIVVIPIARMIEGKASMRSIALISTASVRLPVYPAMSPMKVPTVIARPTATKPMLIEIRAPKTMREKTSRPSLSVPNQCAGEGPCAPSARFCASGSDGAITPAKTAINRIAATTAAPTSAPGARRKRRQTSTAKLRGGGSRPAAAASSVGVVEVTGGVRSRDRAVVPRLPVPRG